MKRMAATLAILACSTSSLLGQAPVVLHNGWQLQSSAKVGTDGAGISSSSYRPTDWHRAAVPSTVVGTMVEDSVFRDPFFGMNLRGLQGMNYAIGRIFVHLAMAPESPYAVPWWYRTTFRVPATMNGKRVTLHLDGVNYRANVWLNGHRIADSTQIVGTYRRHELDVTDQVKRSGTDVLAIEIFAPLPADLQTTWVDWNPSPPDKDMGMWQPAYLTASGDVVVRYPEVISRVDSIAPHAAQLTVVTGLRNLSSHAVTGTLRGRIGSISFTRSITLAAHDSALVSFAPDSFPQLRVSRPHLWWPAELGSPELSTLSLQFLANGRVSDRQNLRFGIREVTAEWTPKGARLFRINGKRILIRGGGWAPDIFFRQQPDRQDAQLQYALDMHLNTLRLEGNYEDDRFFQRTDSLGILVMTGWVCCSAWEEWSKWGPEQLAVSSTVVARSGPPAARACERFRVAERQRRPSAGGCRAGVSRCRKAGSLAESDHFVCQCQGDKGYREKRREDDRALQGLGPTVVLDAGQHKRWSVGVQHGDESGCCSPADREHSQDDSSGGHQASARQRVRAITRRAGSSRSCSIASIPRFPVDMGHRRMSRITRLRPSS